MHANRAVTPDRILQNMVRKAYEALPCRRWMHEAGFRHSRVEALENPESIIVARK